VNQNFGIIQMTEADKSNVEIQESLENFIQHFAAFTSDQYREMRSCSFFSAVPDESLAKLVKVSSIITFRTGASIITEGDVMKSFYVILFGSATVYVKNKKVGRILSGECLGEGTFFAQDAKKRSASVVADSELILLEISKDNIDLIDDVTQKYLNKALLIAMFKKLQDANNKINDLTSENELLNHSQVIELNL
jgi:CRP-like cAMP-binding protein